MTGGRAAPTSRPRVAPPTIGVSLIATQPRAGAGRRIHLSVPHLGEDERRLLEEALDSNWIAPLGPHVDAFEAEFARAVGAEHAVALASGTAALHLALILAGVEAGDEVAVSDATFVASVNPIRYIGARPVFVDSETTSWNMDPALLEEWLRARARAGRLPAAVIVVHLYGQTADLDAILEVCREFGVTVIEDAAEALGARHGEHAPGTLGQFGAFSFNGNKMITTSGGGMLITADAALAARARKLATQAREPAPHYLHTEVGFNYRLSNLLAAVGRGQLRTLEDRVRARRRNFDRYRELLGGLPGVELQPEAPWGRHSRWLTCILIDPDALGVDREALRQSLDAAEIEARPLWMPMHMQPLYAECECVGGDVAADLFHRGLCLPSSSNLTDAEIERVADAVRRASPAVR